jgi:hypothetical protein
MALPAADARRRADVVCSSLQKQSLSVEGLFRSAETTTRGQDWAAPAALTAIQVKSTEVRRLSHTVHIGARS